jgi:tRNA(fMet)-specific endonuclease VapC
LKRYLLDTNHLSAYLDGRQILQPRVDAALQSGDRFGICLPIHCEYRAGIRLSKRYRQNLARLQTALTIIRVWPADEDTAVEFADLVHELRSAGRTMSQFDMLIAAIARQHKLILLTADQDFQPVLRLVTANWL